MHKFLAELGWPF